MWLINSRICTIIVKEHKFDKIIIALIRFSAYNNSVNKFTVGWSKDPGPTYLAGRLPAVFIYRGIMRELSVFVDESGDFGDYEKHAPYYIITMILHDQSVDISAEIIESHPQYSVCDTVG